MKEYIKVNNTYYSSINRFIISDDFPRESKDKHLNDLVVQLVSSKSLKNYEEIIALINKRIETLMFNKKLEDIINE